MKVLKHVAIASLILASATAFSAPAAKPKAEVAAQSEKQLLCQAIDQMMEAQAVDAGMDLKKCLANKTITSTRAHAPYRVLSGVIQFADANRSFTLNCTLTYEGTAEISKIVGGIEGGVHCQ